MSLLVSGLPQLLLSATHLVRLYLWEIPCSGYISPEVMVTSPSVLTRLESLVIEFGSRLDRTSRRLPLQGRTLLSVLTKLQFLGVNEYLEDFVAHRHPSTERLDDILLPSRGI
jgi:hypothetical protein